MGDISAEGVGERCVGGREGEVERVWGEGWGEQTRGNSPGSWKVKSCKILLLSAFYILFHGLKLPFSGIRILTEMDDPSVATADLPGSLEAQEGKTPPMQTLRSHQSSQYLEDDPGDESMTVDPQT